MIRLVCRLEDFLSGQPIGDCRLEARIIVAPRLFGTLPDLSLAQVLSREAVSPPDGTVALDLDATAQFDAIEQLVSEGQAAGTPVAFVEFHARCEGFDLTRASQRALQRDDTFETTIALDFAKSLVGHTTPTSTALWFCLHRNQRPDEAFVCEIDTADTADDATPLQSHRREFRESDLNTTVVRVTSLRPDTRYQYVLRRQTGDQVGQPRRGRALTAGDLVTFSDERDARRLRFAFASCHSPVHHGLLSGGIETVSREALERWVALGRLPASECDMVILMGDQIYADGIEDNFPDDPWVTRFANRYHQQWEYREVRRVLASRPHYMILDDHEVRDDYGTSELDDEIVTNGLRAYRAFQHSHNPGGPDGPFHYGFRRGPVAFFVLDTRTRRATDPDNAGFPVIGQAQLNEFRRWADEDARDADVIVVVTSVPLAWLPVEIIREAIKNIGRGLGVLVSAGNLVAGPINYFIGSVLGEAAFRYLSGQHDLEDQWTFGPLQPDLRRVLTILFDLANDLDPSTGEPRPEGHKRAVFVLGGDVHMGGIHVIESSHDGSSGVRDHRANASIYSLTSSPISHKPPDSKIYQDAIEKVSDDIDPHIVFTGKAVVGQVFGGGLLDAFGKEPATFTLDTEEQRHYRAGLIGMMAERNFGLFEMRRLDAPGRQYGFSFSIEGPEPAEVSYAFTLNLDAATIVPVAASPGLILTPAQIDFGGVQIGTEQSRTLVIRNVSGGSASISLAPSKAGDVFRWSGFDGSLGHGEEHRVAIAFRPTTNEIVNAELTVRSPVLESPAVVGVIGKGPGGFPEPDPDPPPPARLTFEPESINFGTVPLNTVRVRTLTIRNFTSEPVAITIKASPANIPFSWNAFSGNLFGGAERSFELRFRPRNHEIEEATLVVTSTASGSPHRIPLRGKGPGGF